MCVRERQHSDTSVPCRCHTQVLRPTTTGDGGESLRQSPPTSLSTECPDQPPPLSGGRQQQWEGTGRGGVHCEVLSEIPFPTQLPTVLVFLSPVSTWASEKSGVVLARSFLAVA